MAYTKQDLQRIERALVKGELEVQFQDRRARYRSVDEMLRIRSEIVRNLEDAAPSSRVIRLRSAGKGVT
ncbi:phage head-tail joining protein [Ralstonia sp. Ralssp135]|uniref:phage head-tail joining protein n=1 Tax=Ralstonia sp. Ralssp135 TaxID=3243016 RepID=UPI0039AED8AC